MISFLTPLFLIGGALLAIPWLIHQIRRPERDPVRFSSLMFVPDVPREVIERRKIQHILLMLLRMLLLLLLIFAFARPYWKVLAGVALNEPPGKHLILIDTSYSMATLDWFERAKNEARTIIENILPEDRIAVISFNTSPTIRAPLSQGDDPQAGSKKRALDALEATGLSEYGTAYLPALQAAESILYGQEDGAMENSGPLTVHLITDFQQGGIPKQTAGWKLSKHIQLHPVEIGDSNAPNRAILDIALRQTKPKELRIQAKIKNWTDASESPIQVRLMLNGAEQAKHTVAVKRGNASVTTFSLSLETKGPVDGWVEIAQDSLAPENRRYFVWNPPRKLPALLVVDERPDQRWPASWFLSNALPDEIDQPWLLTSSNQDNLAAHLSTTPPSVLLACDLESIQPSAAEAMLEYVSNGGNLLLALNETMVPNKINQNLLNHFGLEDTGFRFDDLRPANYALMAWVDFQHPIFSLFQDPRFNDFSRIRFFNHHCIVLEDSPIKDKFDVIARADPVDSGEEWPLIMVGRFGKGTVVIWTAGLDLSWTTLPKDGRFIALLYETLSYLTQLEDENDLWLVGQEIPAPTRPGEFPATWRIQYPGAFGDRDEDYIQQNPTDTFAGAHSGLVRWKSPDDAHWSRIDAVNVDGMESDPARVPYAEFASRLCSVSDFQRDEADFAMRDRDGAENEDKREWGRQILGILLAFLALESWYAARLSS